MELAGKPVASNAPFEATVSAAHNELKRQRGRDLTGDGEVGKMADWAKKMAANLGNVRNEFGTGHGRARVPEVTDEVVRLSVDSATMWVNWALVRLSWFVFGRPTQLMDDLCGGLFSKWLLEERLRAANIPELEPRTQRALGVAVGQRAASGTVVVWWDGVDTPIREGSLDPWTEEFRKGVASGLLRDRDGNWTLSDRRFEHALRLLDPVAECSEWIDELVDASKTTPPRVTADAGGPAVAKTVAALARQENNEGHRWWKFSEQLSLE